MAEIDRFSPVILNVSTRIRYPLGPRDEDTVGSRYRFPVIWANAIHVFPRRDI